MTEYSISLILFIFMFICTGCVSSSINDSVAAIEHENNRAVNNKLLASIQALRTSQNSSQKMTEQSHTYTYQLHTKELNIEDKLKVSKLINKQNTVITISIAPAKGTNKIHQLSLSMARAKLLRRYIHHFTNKVNIKFAPMLSTDTINVVIGA